MSSNDTILTMENITKTFGPVKALTDVNLSVDRGEIHAICGENGAGKSTLMNVLSGVYPYGSYSGKITFDGKECKYHTINDSEADGIVIIHQELALSPFLSIAENIFIGNEQAKGGVIDWDKTRAEAKKLLCNVTGFKNYLYAPRHLQERTTPERRSHTQRTEHVRHRPH